MVNDRLNEYVADEYCPCNQENRYAGGLRKANAA